MFWSIKCSGEVLSKLKSSEIRATSLSTFDFPILYTTLPHNIKKNLDFNQWTFKREETLYLACNDKKAFSLLQTIDGIHFGLVRMYVTPYRIYQIISTYDLLLNYTDKLWEFRWVQIVLHLFA